MIRAIPEKSCSSVNTVAPDNPLSLKIVLDPIFFNQASCRVGVWSSVDTRAVFHTGNLRQTSKTCKALIFLRPCFVLKLTRCEAPYLGDNAKAWGNTMTRTTVLALVVTSCVPVYAQLPSLGDFTWAQHPTLTWNDFQGPPLKFAPGLRALTDIGLTPSLECRQGVWDVRVEANFHPAGSWVEPRHKGSVELLQHEQGHFDITELYARKMRKAIRDARISCEDRPRDEIILDELGKDYEAKEEQYDRNTQPKGGIDSARQNAASRDIANELAALNAYRQ